MLPSSVVKQFLRSRSVSLSHLKWWQEDYKLLYLSPLEKVLKKWKGERDTSREREREHLIQRKRGDRESKRMREWKWDLMLLLS